MSLTSLSTGSWLQDVEEGAEAVHLVQLARERRGEIEAETVHVHFGDPVAQRIHDHLQHARMHQIERVAAAGVIDVAAPVLRHEAVVAGVVQAAKRQRRPELVAFGGVVVDHVEYDFQAGRVQRLHHGLEFGHLARGRIARLRREIADGVVAPVVAEAALDQVAVVDEGVHGHELDRGDAQPLEIFDRRGAR